MLTLLTLLLYIYFSNELQFIKKFITISVCYILVTDFISAVAPSICCSHHENPPSATAMVGIYDSLPWCQRKREAKEKTGYRRSAEYIEKEEDRSSASTPCVRRGSPCSFTGRMGSHVSSCPQTYCHNHILITPQPTLALRLFNHFQHQLSAATTTPNQRSSSPVLARQLPALPLWRWATSRAIGVAL